MSCNPNSYRTSASLIDRLQIVVTSELSSLALRHVTRVPSAIQCQSEPDVLKVWHVWPRCRDFFSSSDKLRTVFMSFFNQMPLVYILGHDFFLFRINIQSVFLIQHTRERDRNTLKSSHARARSKPRTQKERANIEKKNGLVFGCILHYVLHCIHSTGKNKVNSIVKQTTHAVVPTNRK